MPVEILGMNSSAFAGAEFLVTESENKAKEMVEYKKDNTIKNKLLAKDKTHFLKMFQKKIRIKYYH